MKSATTNRLFKKCDEWENVRKPSPRKEIINNVSRANNSHWQPSYYCNMFISSNLHRPQLPQLDPIFNSVMYNNMLLITLAALPKYRVLVDASTKALLNVNNPFYWVSGK